MTGCQGVQCCGTPVGVRIVVVSLFPGVHGVPFTPGYSLSPPWGEIGFVYYYVTIDYNQSKDSGQSNLHKFIGEKALLPDQALFCGCLPGVCGGHGSREQCDPQLCEQCDPQLCEHCDPQRAALP